MRIVFMGTPEFSVPALHALIAAGHEVVAVYTQPPRPAKRGKKLTLTPVHDAAEKLGIAVRTPVNFKDETERAAFAALAPDIAVVVAYGLILPQAILDAPRHGCINIHASLLPRWRGAAPIQRAILAGDAETGVMTMQMERGLDTGPVLLTARTAIDAKTAGALTAELADMGAQLCVETLAGFEQISPTPQATTGVTYAHKIDKAEAALDFSKAAKDVERTIRAFSPAPGAYCLLGEDRIRILSADIIAASSGTPGTTLDDAFTIACGSGAIRPTLVQRPGKRPMATVEMLRGLAIPAGSKLG